ncbi:MAG TPA: hypothetical protein VFM69_12290 [Pricia sp.]|nr:hypothetical protein [Pricia sp.]
MKINLFLYVIGFFVLLSCGEKNGQETSFEKFQINNSDQYLTLPAGVIENEVTTYEEGFTQHFIYENNSYVILLRGGNAELATPNGSKPERFSREEKINGFHLMYGNVTTERKLEFDQAFDQMKENGLERK